MTSGGADEKRVRAGFIPLGEAPGHGASQHETMTTPESPQELLRSRSYIRLLVLATLLGVVVSAAAYGFLALVNHLQPEIFTHLPHGLGFSAEPALRASPCH